MSPGCADFEPSPQAGAVLSYLEERFGIAARSLAGTALWQRPGSRTIWIAAACCRPWREVPMEAMGLPLLRQPPPRGFPTTAFIVRFGHLATRSALDLAWPESLELMRGVAMAPPQGAEGKGPFILRCGGRGLGRGWLRSKGLIMDVPKVWRDQISRFQQEL